MNTTIIIITACLLIFLGGIVFVRSFVKKPIAAEVTAADSKKVKLWGFKGDRNRILIVSDISGTAFYFNGGTFVPLLYARHYTLQEAEWVVATQGFDVLCTEYVLK